MKIGILTWHKAVNHGAVLQAYASQKILSSMGYDVCLLDYKRNINVQLDRKSILKKRIHRIFSGDIWYRKIYANFNDVKSDVFKTFIERNLCRGKDCYSEDCDAIMIGSDMVFSLIEGYSPYMFGIGLNTKYLFAYASCSGGTNVELLDSMGIKDEVSNALIKFNRIGCRDVTTKEFIKTLCGRSDLYETIDPVLLYGFENEKTSWITGKWRKHKAYVLVYAYHGDLNSKNEIAQIRTYAEQHDLEIISCGYYRSWCDESVNASPEEFFEMFMEAECIITDTFHGTVFSLIGHKRFCSIIRSNGFKLEYLLTQCGLQDRICRSANDINILLNQEVQYNHFNKWLTKQREASKDYLRECLQEAEMGACFHTK